MPASWIKQQGTAASALSFIVKCHFSSLLFCSYMILQPYLHAKHLSQARISFSQNAFIRNSGPVKTSIVFSPSNLHWLMWDSWERGWIPSRNLRQFFLPGRPSKGQSLWTQQTTQNPHPTQTIISSLSLSLNLSLLAPSNTRKQVWWHDPAKPKPLFISDKTCNTSICSLSFSHMQETQTISYAINRENSAKCSKGVHDLIHSWPYH